MATYSERERVAKEKFYLTTAIAYLNGPPHVGHAYEFLTSDVLVRYHQIAGREAYFVTGSDEHGQKVESTAKKMGVSPKAWIDSVVEHFYKLNKVLNLTEHYYVRTSDECHREHAQALWRQCRDAGDIYMGTYKGWYNEKEESFIGNHEAESTGFKDPATGIPYEQRNEETYFFRMSKYHERVLHLVRDTEYLLPLSRRNELVHRLESSPLEDLCVSRSRKTLSWGVPVPDDDEHVMYVWFDALSNYLSAVRKPRDPLKARPDMWPADVHVIGKDITWFHCVIWPAMLMSAGVELPKHVFAHGFVQAADGNKMSKSLGNSLSPMETLSVVSSDTFRYYMVKEGRYGQDVRYSTSALVDLHNADLAANVGNLLHRALALAVKHCDARVPQELPFTVAPATQDAVKATDVEPLDGPSPLFSIEDVFNRGEAAAATFAIEDLAIIALDICRNANKFITEQEPWKIKDDDAKRNSIIRTVLEAIYVAAHYFSPVMPEASAKIFDRLGTPPVKLHQLKDVNLTAGTPVQTGAVLFTNLDSSTFQTSDTDGTEDTIA